MHGPAGPSEELPVVHLGAEAAARAAEAHFENAAYWRGVLRDGMRTYAANLDVRAGVVCWGDHVWPLTIEDSILGSAYPSSLHAQYVAYPREELGLVPSPAQRLAARLGLLAMDALLRAGQVDKTVQWSSWLVSTNLHSAGLVGSLAPVTRALVRAFPRHAVLVKNIDEFGHPRLPQTFARAGYELITARQVYYFDGRSQDYQSKSTVKRDTKAFLAACAADYRVVEHDEFTEADAPRIAELYRLVYLEKHSLLNPRYNERFAASALRGRWLEFRGLRHNSGSLDGVFGTFSMGGATSVPFIGYDTSLPADRGIYRHLVCMLLRQIAERGQLLNYSSGAGDFKRRRGGRPTIEFNAVYTRHLGPRRRAVFGLLRTLADRFGRRFLEENGI